MARNSAAATAVVKAPVVPFCIVEDAAPVYTWGAGVRIYNVSERDSSATVSLGVGNRWETSTSQQEKTYLIDHVGDAILQY